MAITSVGSSSTLDGKKRLTWSLSPTAVGNIWLITISLGTAAATVNTVSGGGCAASNGSTAGRWTRLAGYHANASDRIEIWMGVISTAGANQTLTITVNGTQGTSDYNCLTWREFTAGAGATWAVDVANGTATNASASVATVPFPSLTPTAPHRMYYGAAILTNDTVANSQTSGYSMDQDTLTNPVIWNTDVSSTQAPTTTQTAGGAADSVAALIYATVPGNTLTSDVARVARGIRGGPDTIVRGVTLTSDTSPVGRAVRGVDTPAIGVIKTTDTPLAARAVRSVDTVAVGVTNTSDVARPARGIRGVTESLVRGVTLTSDVARPARAIAGRDTINAVYSANVTLIGDVARPIRALAPRDVHPVDVTLTSDRAYATRTARSLDSLSRGVTLSSDRAVGGRAVAGRDSVTLGVLVASDTTRVVRAVAGRDTVALGVTLRSDVARLVRAVRALDYIADTETNDTAPPVRVLAARDRLAVGVIFYGDLPRPSRALAAADRVTPGVTLRSDTAVVGRTLRSLDYIGNTLTRSRAHTARCLAPVDQVKLGVLAPVDVAILTRTVSPPNRLIGAGAFVGTVRTANPFWPLVGFDVDFSATSGPPNTPGLARCSIDAHYRRVICRSFTTQRGRQYELDQAQAGQATINVVDDYEQLNPDNPASPFNTGGNIIDSYRPMQMWAMWPNQPGSGNLYAETVSLSADPRFLFGTGPCDGPMNPATVVSNDYAQTYTPPQQAGTFQLPVSGSGATTGGHTDPPVPQPLPSLKVVQAGQGPGFGALIRRYNLTAPGTSYCFSIAVRPTGGATVSLQVTDARGTVRAGTQTAVQDSWTVLSVAWTTVDTLEPIVVSATGGASPTFWMSAPQLEFGIIPNPFTVSGPTCENLFTGFVERFPTQYKYDGYQANRPLVAVDALAMLSRTAINQNYDRIIAGDSPQFVIKFDDGAGPAKITGNPPGFMRQSNVKGGTIDFTGDNTPDGAPAVTLSQQIQNSGVEVSAVLYADTLPGTLFVDLSQPSNPSGDTGSSNDPRDLYPGDYLAVTRGSRSVEYCQVAAIEGALVPDPNDSSPDYNHEYYRVRISRGPITDTYLGLQRKHKQGDAVYSFRNQDTTIDMSRHNNYSVQMGGAGATFEGWFKPTLGDLVMLGAGENRSGAVPTGTNISNPNSLIDTFIGLQSFSTGIFFLVNDPLNGPSNTSVVAVPDPTGQALYSAIPDGLWHYYAIRIYANPAKPTQYIWDCQVDGNLIYQGPISGAQAARANVSFNQMALVASTYSGAPQSTVSAAKVAFYPYKLSDAQLMSHYARGSGNVGELSGVRAARLLNTYWGGPIVAAPGYLHMADDLSYDPTVRTEYQTSGAGQSRTVLDVLQEIQDSERGFVWADKDGLVIFEDRQTRYLSQYSMAILGENPANDGSEYPYSDYEADFDPTYTYTQADITSPGNQDFLPVVNQAAQNKYGQRVITQEVQCQFDYDLQAQAIFYLSRYSKPRTRISKLTLNASGNPQMFALVLNMDLSQRYTVVRRSRTGLVVQGDYYIESISHNVDFEAGKWEVDLQLSPVFVGSAWQLGDPTLGVLGQNTAPIY